MSAPFSPAAWTRTSSCPSWGSGSGCSTTSIRPSRMVAARMPASVPLERRYRRLGVSGNKADVGVPFPQFWREGLAGVEAAALRRSTVWRGGGVAYGEDRPVLLIPGFMAGDGSLSTMTQWLRVNGYRTHRAGIRVNTGC